MDTLGASNFTNRKRLVALKDYKHNTASRFKRLQTERG